MYGLKTEASFDSAHFLTDYYGKCENLHGHRWRAVVHLAVDDLQAEGTMKGMVLDFGGFKRAVREAEGFSLFIVPFRTTAENLARYFCDCLAEQGLPVSQVEMYETPNNCAVYRPQ